MPEGRWTHIRVLLTPDADDQQWFDNILDLCPCTHGGPCQIESMYSVTMDETDIRHEYPETGEDPPHPGFDSPDTATALIRALITTADEHGRETVIVNKHVLRAALASRHAWQ